MESSLDALDRKILAALQEDATRPLEELAQAVDSSKTPVWNRIRKLRASGVIRKQVALVDHTLLGLNACFYVLIRTAQHEKKWQSKFLEVVASRPEILEAHRLAGDVDYLLKVRVKDPEDYDRFYQSLVEEISIFNVTSLLSMQEIFSRTALPVD